MDRDDSPATAQTKTREPLTTAGQRLTQACRAAISEAQAAMFRYKPFNSSHEGYAVLLEEVDELWDAIKSNDLAHARKEAIQVAAMALRFITDVPTSKDQEGKQCNSTV